MNNIARNLHARGVKPGDKVAFYMRNGIEYGELTGACFLGRLTHVNVNYRYKPEEVRYIVDNSDATVVVYAREFRDTVAQIHNQLDKVKVFVEVGDRRRRRLRHAVREARHHRQRRDARHRALAATTR